MSVRCCGSVLVAMLWLAPWAVAQSNYSWINGSGAFSDPAHWSLGSTTPAGPPGASDRATFFPGGTFTVSGNGSVARVVIQVTDVTFTGTIAASGGFSGASIGVEVGVTGLGKATFTGAGAALNSSGPLVLGSGTNGEGVLDFNSGATGMATGVGNDAAVVLGGAFTSSGTMLIENTGSLFTSTGSFLLGGRAAGQVTVTDEGELHTNGVLASNAAGLNIGGGEPGSVNTQGTLTITNNGVVHNELQTNVGLYGKGTIDISSGSFTTTNGGIDGFPAISIARFAGSKGNLNVSGTGHVVTQGEIIVGGSGMGGMSVTGQGLVESFVTVGAPAIVGFASTANGLATIDGAEARWEITDALVVGQQGTGRLELLNGGTVFIDDTVSGGDPYINIGDADGSLGEVLISDEFSYLDASFIPTQIGYLAGSLGRLEITDLGSAFLQRTTIGGAGIGYLSIHDSGSLVTGTAVLGALTTGSGSVDLESGAVWEVLGQLVIGGDGSGDIFVFDDATLTVDELIELGAGPDSFGTLTISSSTATVDGGFASVSIGALGDGQLTLDGDASWSVDGDVSMGLFSGSRGGASIAPQATWNITGGLYVGGFATSAGGVGELEIQGRVTADTRVAIWDDGVANLINDATLASPLVENHGQITGNGTVDSAQVINDGLVSPSRSISFPTARITFTGDYEQTAAGVLEIQIGGLNPFTEFDQIVIDGTASLQGELQVSLIDIGFGPFVPVLDNQFVIMTVAAFDDGQPTYDPADVTLPELPSGLAWDLVYTSTELILKVIAGVTGLPGDYNEDNVVDAADYTVWRDAVGSPTALPNDDTPGVAEDDYTRWRTHFGDTAPQPVVEASTAPEPCGVVLVLVGLGLCGVRTRAVTRYGIFASS